MRRWFGWLMVPEKGPPEPLPPQEVALALLRGVAAELVQMMDTGSTWSAARDVLIAKYTPAWEETHGRVVAYETRELLRRLGPAAFLTPYGAEMAGLIPKGSTRPYYSSKKQAPHWFWLVLQWIANWR